MYVLVVGLLLLLLELILGESSPSLGDDEKSKSKVSRNESPGCRMTLACSEELISEQADGLAHLGGFYHHRQKYTRDARVSQTYSPSFPFSIYPYTKGNISKLQSPAAAAEAIDFRRRRMKRGGMKSIAFFFSSSIDRLYPVPSLY